jgi:hypothetical protein
MHPFGGRGGFAEVGRHLRGCACATPRRRGPARRGRSIAHADLNRPQAHRRAKRQRNQAVAPSGSPKVITTTEPPRLVTRPTSRSAATGFPAYCNELKPVTTSKLSSANGSCSRSPWRKSPVGTRDRQHCVRRVDARHLGPTGSRHLCRHTRAAAGVEISGAGPHARALEHGLENRADRPFLKVGPVSCARTPKGDRVPPRFSATRDPLRSSPPRASS